MSPQIKKISLALMATCLLSGVALAESNIGYSGTGCVYSKSLINELNSTVHSLKVDYSAADFDQSMLQVGDIVKKDIIFDYNYNTDSKCPLQIMLKLENPLEIKNDNFRNISFSFRDSSNTKNISPPYQGSAVLQFEATVAKPIDLSSASIVVSSVDLQHRVSKP